MAPVSMLPLPVRAQQRWTLLAVCLAALALPLSFSAGAVAVPVLARSVATSPTALAWVTNAFMLTFGSLLLAAGGLADRYGRRRLFLLGTAGFSAATAVVCLAPTLLWLDLARGLQGVAAAAALASGTAALAQAWQGPARARVFALLGTTFGAGLALGPLLAGLLLQALGWRSVFAAGGVLALAAFVLGARVLPESHGERGHLDLGGMLGFSLMLAALTLALLWLGEFGLHALRVQLALLATLLLGGVFVCIERVHHSPLLDFSLFSQPAFLGVQLLPVATCFGYVVLLVVLPLQLLGVHGQSATAVGLQMLALSAPMLVLPMLAARWAERIGSARLCTLGLLVCATGLYLLSRHAPRAAPVALAVGAVADADRCRNRVAVGPDGWAVGQRGAGAACGDGRRHLRNGARSRRRHRIGRSDRVACAADRPAAAGRVTRVAGQGRGVSGDRCACTGAGAASGDARRTPAAGQCRSAGDTAADAGAADRRLCRAAARTAAAASVGRDQNR